MKTLTTTFTATAADELGPSSDQVANFSLFRFFADVHAWLYSAFAEVFSKLISADGGYISKRK